MKLNVKIKDDKIIITEPMVDDIYYIEENEYTNKFYIRSYNGYTTAYQVEYKNIPDAIVHVKNLIKNYFSDRCIDKPKGF